MRSRERILLPVLLASLLASSIWLLISRSEVESTGGQMERAASAESMKEESPREKIAVEPGTTVVRGQCVDEEGLPLSGVQVELFGRKASDERMHSHMRAIGVLIYEAPVDQVTGLDGRFEFVFDPPAAYEFFLSLEVKGRVRMTARWDLIEPGSIRELGSVEMPSGAIVTGRLVDGDGAPIAPLDEAVQLSSARHDPFGPAIGVFGPRTWHRATHGENGTFVVRDRLASGAWLVSLRGFDVTPTLVEIDDPGTEVKLTVPERSSSPNVNASGAAKKPNIKKVLAMALTTRRIGTYPLPRYLSSWTLCAFSEQSK